jgi:hypothetical protein
MRESEVEAALVKRVKSLGGMCEKFSSPSKRAVPDRIVTLPFGVIIFVELKGSSYNKPTVLQARDHYKRRMLGCDVRVINSLAGVAAFPNQLEIKPHVKS